MIKIIEYNIFLLSHDYRLRALLSALISLREIAFQQSRSPLGSQGRPPPALLL
jgi:hypothetical protein